MTTKRISNKPLLVQIGDKFNNWTVIDFAPLNQRQDRRWLCRCVCGTERIVLQYHLRGGNTKSCGCQKKYAPHGHVNTHTYGCWQSMKARCLRPSHEAFKNYGGRGISICKEWLDSFPQFLADMGECPSEKHSIERINADGNYDPSNCVWATSTEQSRNKRNTVWVEINGIRKCLADWCVLYKVPYHLASQRIKKGWDAEKALSAPAQKRTPSRLRLIPELVEALESAKKVLSRTLPHIDSSIWDEVDVEIHKLNKVLAKMTFEDKQKVIDDLGQMIKIA